MRRALMTGPLALVLLLAAGTAGAQTTCPEDPDTKSWIESQVDGYLADWTARRPAKAIGADADLLVARCTRDRLVEKLVPHLGKVVGYKAGLTAKAVQQRFGVDAPVTGVLLETMLLPDGTTLPAGFGARPVWEADMLLVVKDEGINDATTADEVLKHIRAMRPFIELPDLSVAEGQPFNGAVMTAINVGARFGVAGAEVPLEPTAATAEALRTGTITAVGGDGAVLARSSGEATLGTPLNAALWLVSDLAESGKKLAAGDLISVGSFSPLTPPKPGQTVTVTYEGLPGVPRVSVTFE